jgi:uncharacterized protein
MIRSETSALANKSEIAPEDAVLSLIAATPDHQVQGRKRLQKLLYLCAYSRAPISARFKIKHYGVYSPEIADAVDFLSVFGDLDTNEVQVGPSGYFSTVFSLSKSEPAITVHPVIKCVAKDLSGFPTSTLEVASTIAFFMGEGCAQDQAIANTAKIKPNLTTEKQIDKSKALLEMLSKIGAQQNGQRSANSRPSP